MVKKLQEESTDPVRQSRRNRVLNTRLGTPPKILLDMLRDHSSSPVVKKSLSPVAEVQKIETISQKAAGISSNRNVKSPNITVQSLGTESHGYHHVAETFEAGRFSKSITSGTVEETATFDSNDSRKSEVSRNLRNGKMRILSKTLGNTVSKIRHSSRIRIPNSRYDYLLPGLLEQSKNKERRDNMKKNDDKKDDTPMLKKEKVVQSSKIVCGKSNMAVRPRHSKRQRFPNKRLSFPDVCPIARAQKKSTIAKSKIEKIQKRKNYGKEPVNVLKIRSSRKATSRSLSLSFVSNNRQIHSDLEVPSVLYPYRPAKIKALCAETSSSMTKDHISKKDVKELIVELNQALARVTGEDYSELREKIAHHLNNLHRENCRFRQALQQLRSELDNLSSNSTISRYNALIKQNGELRELKVLADMKCETQMAKVHKLLERIKILEVRNKNLEEFRSRLIKQRNKKELNDEIKHPHTAPVNDLSKIEAQDVMNAELKSVVLNRVNGEGEKDDKSNGNDVAWGNDSWMLHC